MQIKVKLFSNLMEYLPDNADGNTVTINLATASCHAITDHFKIPRMAIQVIMVNGEFVPEEQRSNPLKEGDTVSVWPSIQGG